MSDTPRADGCSAIYGRRKLVELCHTLERELNEANRKLAIYNTIPKGSPWQDEGCAFSFGEWMLVRQLVIDERDALKRELDELRGGK